MTNPILFNAILAMDSITGDICSFGRYGKINAIQRTENQNLNTNAPSPHLHTRYPYLPP